MKAISRHFRGEIRRLRGKLFLQASYNTIRISCSPPSLPQKNDSVASSLSWSRPAERKPEADQFADCDKVHETFYQ